MSEHCRLEEFREYRAPEGDAVAAVLVIVEGELFLRISHVLEPLVHFPGFFARVVLAARVDVDERRGFVERLFAEEAFPRFVVICPEGR